MITIDLQSLVIALIVGLAAGFVANSLMGSRQRDSLLMNLILGLAGAFVASLLLPVFGLTAFGIVGQFLASLAGAILIIFVVRLLTGGLNSGRGRGRIRRRR
jgi:uncharacterized membrane protein YeaQ/YmgE (transglycosylase-associated protein family)